MNYSVKQVESLEKETFTYLKVNLKNNVLTIRLNRPEKRNAMNPKMMEEIAFALAYAHYTPEVFLVVLEAEGPVFSAGADLKAFAGDQQEKTNSTIPPAEGEVLLGELMVQVHKPTIAKVHAPVYAGGHMLIGGCTYVIAVEEASFSLPEVKRGLFPMQVMATLLQTLPPRRVLNWCISGRTLSALEAYDLGLVTHLVEKVNLNVQTQHLTEDLKLNSPKAMSMGLKAYDALRSLPGGEQQAYLKKMLDEILTSEDAKEGLAAFKEKRTPKWTGR